MRTTSPAPTPRVERIVEPSEFRASQITPSGICVTTSGSSMDPTSVETTTDPSAPTDCAVLAESRATTGRAVAARYGSPSCRRPRSSSGRQEATTTSPAASSVRSSAICATDSTRGPTQGPIRRNSERMSPRSPCPRSKPASVAIIARTRESERVSDPRRT